MKILIIRDSQDDIQDFYGILEKYGHNISVIDSIRQGISLINSDPSLDLIILAISEDNCGALNLLRHTKKSQRLRRIPYMIVSRDWNSDMVRLCRQLGAEDLIKVPCSDELLHTKISNLLKNGKRVILVVENDCAVMRLLKNILEIERFRVICATDAGQAMSIIMQKEVHLVLSEVMLPNHSGLELLAAIKRQKTDLPVILIASQDEGYREADIIASDADDFLCKPFRNTEIVTHIRKFMG